MSLFVATLREPSDDHVVEVGSDAFLVRARPGRSAEFDRLARRILDHYLEVAAFARKDATGRYDQVEIIEPSSWVT